MEDAATRTAEREGLLLMGVHRAMNPDAVDVDAKPVSARQILIAATTPGMMCA